MSVIEHVLSGVSIIVQLSSDVSVTEHVSSGVSVIIQLSTDV